MGFTEYLAGHNAPIPSNLPSAIDELEDTSHVFVRRWTENSLVRAGEITTRAMMLLDFIANELIRKQVELKGLGAYTGSAFATAFSKLCGRGVTGVTLAQQEAMVKLGPGNGAIQAVLGTPSELDLHRILNKIKHRHALLINFRIDAGRHIFVICPEHTTGGAEGIYEFDVLEFCRACKRAVDAL